MSKGSVFRIKLEPGKKYRRVVFDIECDDLLNDLTKMHVFVAKDLDSGDWFETTDVEEAAKFIGADDVIAIGHYITGYDLPALSKLVGYEVKPAKVIDTLPLSQYLFPTHVKFGLEQFGEIFGIAKPEVKDWKDLTIEEYTFRCQEDVKINEALYLDCIGKLKVLYEGDNEMIDSIICYLTFKFECIREQLENPFTLDTKLLFTELKELTTKRDNVKKQLASEMPKVVKKGIKSRPKILRKKDGSLSAHGIRWVELLRSEGFSDEEIPDVEEVEVVTSIEDPNPDSTEQVKDWLFSLGWEPCTFKYVLDKPKSEKTGKREFKTVPQISQLDDKTELTPSITRLSSKNPKVELLAGYSTLKHRVAILEGFIRDSHYGKIGADASGVTNTLRMKHRVIVNLPKPRAPYAEHIRECLKSPEGYYMVGSDLTGVEDYSKQHYIYPYDPEYVDSMRTPGFDPHNRIAVLAELITKDDEEFYKNYDAASKEEKEEMGPEAAERFNKLKLVRNDAKIVNFSATYSVGYKTLARNGGFSEEFAKKLLKTYWDLNWAIEKFAEDRQVKTIDGQMWVKQPVSGFWYSLRNRKDIFSTVNQSSAVFIFDLWTKYCREAGLKTSLQIHDELAFLIKEGVPQEEVTKLVMGAMDRVNETLKLNVEFSCSLDFGINYKEVH